MANEQKKKTASTGTTKKTNTSNGKRTATQTNASTTGHKKTSGTKKKTPSKKTAASTGKGQNTKGSSTKSTPKLTRDEQKRLEQMRDEKKARAQEKKKNFSAQYMPYILGVVGIFLLVTLVGYLFNGDVDPEDYWMGPIGYWVGYFFYGLFGWPTLCVPVLVLYLAAFWRKNCREDTVVFRTVLAVLLMVCISAIVHAFACHGNSDLADIDLIAFYEGGALFECGGLIGGLLGALLYTGLKLWGTILVSVLVLPLLVMFLVGVTPAYVASLIKNGMATSREEKAERRAHKNTPERDAGHKRKVKEVPVEEDDDDYVPPRVRRQAPVDDETPEGESKKGKKKREIIHMDAQTGEVLDDDELVEEDVVEDDLDEGDPTEDDVVENDAVEDDDDDAYVPAATAKRRVVDVPADDETAEGEEPADDTDAEEPEDDGEVADGETDDDTDDEEPADIAEHLNRRIRDDGDDGDDEGDSLYIPSRPISREKRTPVDSRTPADRRRTPTPVAQDADDEGVFAVDDLPEDMETVEITWDEDATEVEETVAEKVREKTPEKLVVVVNRQETAAVTSTPDHHVDGLPDEEIVLPSGTGAVVTDDGEGEEREYVFPPIDLLIPGPSRYEADEDEIVRNTQTLRSVLESFHIRVKEISCSCGPTITRYEVKPDTGVRVRSIANLVDDIALGLAKSGVRIEAPIPGKAAVGIEVPNDTAATVALRNLIETPEFMNHKSRVAACLGADVAGRPVMMDINKMPHLLVAGTTGSGKSVCINSIIMSILYKAKPDEVKLILIDPKKVEFAVYRDLPHLYCPLISDPKKAAGALNSAVVEMERRFELIEEVGVRNIAGYNEATAGDPERPPLPQMVIIIDELADLMMTASNEVETAICRLAQKARAAGIHLILGTQRPSVDVITGLIKANVPSRIAFTVSAAVDSRTIIDTVGAEKLIGRGDMLYSPVGSTKPMRVQGTFVSDGEVEKVVTFLKEHNAQIEYDESFMHMIEVEAAKCGQGKKKGGDVGNIEDFSALGGDDEDGKFWAAVEVAVDAEKISTSLLQRRLNLGYGRAAKIIDRMEEMGFVGPADGNKPRKLLITKQDLAEIRISGRAEGSGDE